jgi:hypothetical protein
MELSPSLGRWMWGSLSFLCDRTDGVRGTGDTKLERHLGSGMESDSLGGERVSKNSIPSRQVLALGRTFLSQQNTKSLTACGKRWGRGDFVVSCKTCEMDPTW